MKGEIVKKILFCLMLLCSGYSFCWDIQNGAYCKGVGFSANHFKRCLPDEFTFYMATDDYLWFKSSAQEYASAIFKFGNYADSLMSDVEDAFLFYKGTKEYRGNKIYVHHQIAASDMPIFYKWSIVLEESELYLVLTDLDEARLAKIVDHMIDHKVH
jgi:hypothetical protein